MSIRAAALVAGLAAAVWVASRDPAPIAVPTLYFGYQSTYPVIAQLIEPVLRAPWVGAVPWLAAGLLALCLGSEAWLLALAYGASPSAAAAAAVAMLATAGWTESVRHGGALAIALALSWLTWLFLTRRSTEPSIAPALVTWVAAIATSWVAFIVAPMVLAALTVGEHRKRVRAGFLVLGLIAGLTGVALYCLRVAALTVSLSATGAPEASSLDVLAQVFNPVLGPHGSPRDDLLAVSLPALALAAIGAAGASARRRWRGGIAMTVLLGAGVALLWPFWRAHVSQFALWLSTPFVAVGITLLARAVAPRREALATVTVGVVLCGVIIGDRFTSEAAPAPPGREPLEQIRASLGGGALFVVEDLDVDAAVIGSYGAGASGWRVPQDAAYVRERLDAGQTIVAGPVARRNLELAGFRFRRVAGDDRAFTLSKAVGQMHCAVVRTDRWSLLPGLEYTGRLGVEIPAEPGGHLTLVIGDDERPPIVVTSARGDVLKPSIEPLLTAPAAATPPPDYWLDGGDPARAPPGIVRVRLPAHPATPTLLDVALGRRAPRVLARLMNMDNAAARGRVCASPLAAPEMWAEADAARELTVPLTNRAMLTSGWYGVEADDAAGPHRWTGQSAIVLVPSAVRVPVRVTIDARPAVRPRSGQAAEMPTLTLRVNGVQQPSRVMRDGTERYEWQISARTWLAGTNELMFSVSNVLQPAGDEGADSRVLGMQVRRLTLTRED